MKKTILSIVAIILYIAASAQIPESGLVHSFKFDGSGFNDASTTNFAVSDFGANRHEIADRSVYLSNFQTPRNLLNIPTGNNARTFSVWAKTNFLHLPSHIFAYGASNFTTYGLYISPNQITNLANGSSLTYSSQSGILQNNEWYHIVLTHTGTTSHMYLNGILVASETRTLNTDGIQFYIGCGGNASQNFQGYLDDLLIYNRALSQQEITALYNCGTFAPPLVTTPAEDLTICAGTSATLTTAATGTVQWMISPTSHTVIHTGSSFTTPVLGSTTTYYVRQYTGDPMTGCYSERSPVTVTVRQNNESPIFEQAPSICAGETLDENTLPSISANAITGTWSPAPNSNETTLYTFIPDAGQCEATTTTMTIAVYQARTPAFNPRGSVCPNSAFTLPSTSVNGVTGTWTPAINRTVTTTYTFTPDTGQCEVTTATMTVEIGQLTPPVMTTPAHDLTICASTSAILTASAIGTIQWMISPTSHTVVHTGNSFTTPVLNENTTYYIRQYTGDPMTGCYSNRIPVTVTVNAVTPVFTQTTVCEGAANPLPATSVNGITGTWTPAWNAYTTTNYTFTPDAGQCARPATMTVMVQRNETPVFTQVLPVCPGDTLISLPVISNNGIEGTWAPAVNNNETTTYTFTPALTCGAAPLATMTITVNAPNTEPVFTIANSLCYGAANPLPSTSNNGIRGTWAPAWNGTQTRTYTFTPNEGQCGTTTSAYVMINTSVTGPTLPQNTTPTTNLTVCQGSATSLSVAQAVGITVQWFDSPHSPTVIHTGHQYTTPSLYNTTTYYVRRYSSSGCYTPRIPVTVTVIPSGATPLFDQIEPICTGEMFTLPARSVNGITGTWSPAVNNTQTTEYTFTPDAGQCGVTSATTMTVEVNPPAIIPVFVQIEPVCPGASNPLWHTSANGIVGAWLPVWNSNTETTYTFTPNPGQCATTTTMTVAVEPMTITTPTEDLTICSGQTATITASGGGIIRWYNHATSGTLLHEGPVFTTSALGQNRTYYVDQCYSARIPVEIMVNQPVVPEFTQIAPTCAGTALTALPAMSNNNIAGTWALTTNEAFIETYTFTPDSEQCAAKATMTITVTPSTTPLFSQVAPVCEGAALAALPVTSDNGITGTWSPAVNSNATTVYTFTPHAEASCTLQTTMTISVIPTGATPTFAQIAPICEGQPLALPTTSDNGITGTWSPAINNATTVNYTFTPNSEQCGATTTNMTVAVLPASASIDTRTEEAPFTWINGQTYTASNNAATHILQSANGCDSVVTLNLTIDNSNSIQVIALVVGDGNCPDVEISISNAVFPVTLSITWVGNITPLTTTIHSSPHIYTKVCPGSYTLTASDANSRTATVHFNPTMTVGVDPMWSMINSISMYPNPGSSVITLENIPVESTITLFDMTGQTVYTVISSESLTPVKVDTLADGVYYLQISNATYGIVTKKLMISR